MTQEGLEDRQDFQNGGERTSLREHPLKSSKNSDETFKSIIPESEHQPEAEKTEKHLFKRNWTVVTNVGSVVL